MLLTPAAVFERLSVVIPVALNDLSWRQLLNDLSAFEHALEIILVACSPPPTDIKLASNVVWIQAQQGRPQQLNAGAQQTNRDFIWFLHADTQLTTAVMPAVHNYIQHTKTTTHQLAYFRLKFAQDGPKQTCLNAWAANKRSQFLSLPFGDQGFIINKRLFTHMQGFDETLKRGEDVDFVIRLQSANITLRVLSATLITSARRYQQYGWLLTSIRHVWLTWRLARQARQRLCLPKSINHK